VSEPQAKFPIEGGCDCRSVRYRLESAPLIVHCCHCRWCQRESGASFALNAMIESDRVTILGAEPELILTPSDSGLGQRIARCPNCRVALWSHYAGSGSAVRFVRVGTLDDPDLLPPDVHIFTASKQPWVVIPDGMPAFAEYYEREKVWSAESLARREALLPLIETAASSSAQQAHTPFVPPGWPRVVPRILSHDPEGLVRFIQAAFGAGGEYRESVPSELWIGDSIIMVSGTEARAAAPAVLYVYVEDADAVFRKAVELGADVVEEPFDTPYGDLRGMVHDTWGNTWQIATWLGNGDEPD
jgi:uncharacterized glyoxalase superfamily protein PhnB